MSEQLSFLDATLPRPPTDGLFFAVFPPARPAAAMCLMAQQDQSEHRLKGRLQTPDRLHLSLIGLGEYDGLPQRTVDRACEAAASVAFAPFDVAFDRVESFFGKPGSHPRALRGGDGRLTAFHLALSLAVKTAGLGKWIKPLGAPHVTLMYGDRRVDSQTVTPIGWTVTEFVLVHSLLGRSQYIPLGRWPLRS